MRKRGRGGLGQQRLDDAPHPRQRIGRSAITGASAAAGGATWGWPAPGLALPGAGPVVPRAGVALLTLPVALPVAPVLARLALLPVGVALPGGLLALPGAVGGLLAGA